jgi:hypothetical protein
MLFACEPTTRIFFAFHFKGNRGVKGVFPFFKRTRDLRTASLLNSLCDCTYTACS